MAVVNSVASQHNTFIPNTDATNNMVVDFSRNVADFALPRYIQYVPVTKTKGKYIRMTVEQAGRITGSTSLEELSWPDGADSPRGNDGKEKFGFQDYTTARYQSPYSLGELGVEQAEWDILAQHSRIHAQRMMTARTMAVHALLATSGNWDSSHYSATPEAITGVTGRLDLSTTNRRDIKRTFDYMFDQIRKDTLGGVKKNQIHIVVSPEFAKKITVCQEIVDYIKQSPASLSELKDGLHPNNLFGLPEQLYGYSIEVEDSVKVTSHKGVTAVKGNVWGDGDVVMLSRPGALEGTEGGPTFSTATLFLKEDLTVESKHDRDERAHKGRVVDDWSATLTAPVSGFYLASALST
tara:strand:+ start:3065 stop:4120 length:1056 start_codon:yes stop_codon:yes gene_type:complete